MSGCGWVVFASALWWPFFWWAEQFVGVVVVVDAVLSGVQEWRGDPCDPAVAANPGAPAVVGDEAVVGAAGQGEVGDVGLSAFSEDLGGVVGLAVIRRCGAAGSGAAAVAVEQR
jgi:glycine cleavage system aminomethyltransferase T